MSLVKDLFESVVHEGVIKHEFSIKNLKFVLRGLSVEEQLVADTMIDNTRIREKYGMKNRITLNDTIAKHRSIALVALATESVNGKSPVDTEKTMAEQHEQRMELQAELMSLNSAMVTEIIREYNKLVEKQEKFYKNFEENVEKS